MENAVKITVMILIFIVVSGLLQHIAHETFHIVIGKLSGLTLISAKLFTYHGGTKVTFKDEEEVINNSDECIPKKWIIMNLAGIIGTTSIAYIIILIYSLLPIGYIKLFFWVLSAMFLVTDSGYSVICSFSKSGDLYLVSKYFKNSIFIKIISISLLILNIMIFISIR